MLNRELALQDLYDLPQEEVDLVIAETAEIGSPEPAQHFSHVMDHLWHGAKLGITPHIQRKLEHPKI